MSNPFQRSLHQLLGVFVGLIDSPKKSLIRWVQTPRKIFEGFAASGIIGKLREIIKLAFGGPCVSDFIMDKKLRKSCANDVDPTMKVVSCVR